MRGEGCRAPKLKGWPDGQSECSVWAQRGQADWTTRKGVRAVCQALVDMVQ